MDNKIVIFSTTSGMTKICRKVLAYRNLKNIPIYEMTTNSALAKAQSCITQGTKVIISRGGTADFLREHLDVPVVNIRHSFLSILQNVRRARGKYKVIAFVGFSQLCEAVRKYNSVMDDQVLAINITSEKEFETGFFRALEQGAQAIVGGLQIETICRRREFPFFASYPDESEVNQALDEAFYSVRVEEERARQHELLTTIINNTSEGIVSIDRDGNVLYINQVARNLLHYCDGDQIQTLLPSPKIMQAALNGGSFLNELVTVRGTTIVFNCLPIKLSKQVIGAVITLQEETAIRAVDIKIRKKLLGRGHYAKKHFDDIIGRSKKLIEVKKTAQRYASTDSSILITGETGTGKEMFAQSIHNYSSRRHAPFIAVNCAALPQNILESELFGYVRGAFTGARSEGKAGIFELAHTGTVFLDEISELPNDVQVKLLRVLQEKEITRIGDDRVIPVDVRIIAASNKDLQREVVMGRFRKDLYYRICVLELKIPPLRERSEDIPELICHFLHGRKVLSEEAEQFLKTQLWPGNIRQLSNVAQRIDAVCLGNVISLEDVRSIIEPDLPADNATINPTSTWEKELPPDFLTKQGLLSQMEDALIRRVLAETGGNRERAAAILGISVTTLWRKTRANLKSRN
ncbi:MAG: sigma 54-interacting transcriptional regulator [Firmicutes bacterium]|nr:sigma 54-interacting transcriptional regulator [Bacillota bacterium]